MFLLEAQQIHATGRHQLSEWIPEVILLSNSPAPVQNQPPMVDLLT